MDMKMWKSAVILFGILFIIVGVIYPLVVTGVSNLLFPWRSHGSLIYQNEECIGSVLIGQPFSDPKYFWPRPSSTPEFPYNAMFSGGSNLGPTNEILIKRVQERIDFLEKSGIKKPIPSALVLSSGSGLDPDITLESALVQIPRISKFTGIPVDKLEELVRLKLKDRMFGFMGEKRVNVLELNLELIKLENTYSKWKKEGFPQRNY